jgi:predicted amidophosphoribosyltransferase
MDKKARAITVRNAFDVQNAESIKGSHILLVDDVLTSGATASSCAGMLKKNGAGRVDVLTLARAV